MTAVRTCLMIGLLAAALTAAPAAAQVKPDSERLFDAIEARNTNEVVDLVGRRGGAVVNVRSYTGATPLTAAMRQRVVPFVAYLLQNGANPNLADKSGDTALMIAARIGYLEGISTMITAKAAVDQANRQGETALIIAVQNRHVQAVRLLLKAGASATRTDNASGLSARGYAERDRRSTEILKLIDSAKPKPVFVAGPVIE